MTVAYLQLSYEDYKCLEKQMRAFAETTHVSTPGPFYHKSIRLQISPDLIIEFHGPTVRGMEEEVQPGRYPPIPDYQQPSSGWMELRELLSRINENPGMPGSVKLWSEGALRMLDGLAKNPGYNNP